MSSWKISVTERLTQRRPKRTRGLCSRTWEVGDPGVDGELEERDPGLVPQPAAEESGELTAAASTGAVTAWAML